MQAITPEPLTWKALLIYYSVTVSLEVLCVSSRNLVDFLF